ncbi:MAG: hypothetical protein GWP91_10795 [Rhodobacterales bacterium]|nr:hypothetical protein [Rhodobacterales bacterium]
MARSRRQSDDTPNKSATPALVPATTKSTRAKARAPCMSDIPVASMQPQPNYLGGFLELRASNDDVITGGRRWLVLGFTG